MRIGSDIIAAPVRAAVEAHAGPIRAFHPAASGVNSDIAGIVDAPGGRVFLKATRDDCLAAAGQQREVEVNPAVAGVVSPRLLWHEATGGWSVLAFEVVEGHHADYAPGSPDLPKLAVTLDALAELPCPRVPMLSASRRWGPYLDNPDDAKHFTGNSLLHTDANPSNYLIADGRAWLVDWAWATRGAAFIDIALLLPRLVDAGHSLADAEGWAARHAVWRDADPCSISVFARAVARQWQGFADRNPGEQWRLTMAQAAAGWADHRAVIAR